MKKPLSTRNTIFGIITQYLSTYLNIKKIEIWILSPAKQPPTHIYLYPSVQLVPAALQCDSAFGEPRKRKGSGWGKFGATFSSNTRAP